MNPLKFSFGKAGIICALPNSISIGVIDIITMKHVARRAGVSIGTVSAVLNGKETVKDTTRERVQQAIEELDYRPNALARALFKKQTKTVAFLVPDIKNPGFSSALKGIGEVARERDYAVMVADTNGSIDVAVGYVGRLIDLRVDGVLLALTYELARPEVIEPLQKHDIRIVGVTSARCMETIDCFQYNEELGANKAATYLCGLGHRQIAFIGPNESATAKQRLYGLEQALSQFGATVDPKLNVVAAGYGQSSGFAAGLELISRGFRFTSVMVFNDRMAVGVLDALVGQGYRVPEDVSIISFGDEFANMVRPKLTTVKNPEIDLGRQAMHHLVDALDQGAAAGGQRIVLEPQLVLRGSTGKA